MNIITDIFILLLMISRAVIQIHHVSVLFYSYSTFFLFLGWLKLYLVTYYMQNKNMFVSKLLADMLSYASLFSLLRGENEWRHVYHAVI